MRPPNETVKPPAGFDALAVHAQKDLLRVVVVGSVDDGKSTLIGRLLYEGNGLFEDQLAAVRKASKGGTIDFSLFTDGLQAEREQRITIDVAYRSFHTLKRRFIIADTPGHLQYTRNMATGASTADAAILLVDARLGVLAQTKRHAYITALFGIRHVAMAINKLDLFDFEQQVFDRLADDVRQVAQHFGINAVEIFPVSAAQGDNITSRSQRTPWYSGPSLLQWLESVPTAAENTQKPLRFVVQGVTRPNLDYRGFAGQVLSGSVAVGDEIEVLPSRRRATVTALDTFEGPLTYASSPTAVTVRLSDALDISRGDQFSHLTAQPSMLHRFECHLLWLGETPLRLGQRYLLKHASRTVPAQVEQVVSKTDLETLAESDASSIALNDISRVRVLVTRPIFADAYRDNRRTGGFILIDPTTFDTVGAGMILTTVDAGGLAVNRSSILPAERASQVGHRAGVVLLPASLSQPQLFEMERKLFDSGLHVTVSDCDPELTAALVDAGLVVLSVDNGTPSTDVLRTVLRELSVPLHELREPDVDAIVRFFKNGVA